MPSVEQMSAMEYDEAVENGDARISPDDRNVFESCRDTEIGWLPFDVR